MKIPKWYRPSSLERPLAVLSWHPTFLAFTIHCYSLELLPAGL